MRTFICNTKFKLDPFADGGSKRSVQIRQLFNDNGFAFVEDDFVLPKGLSKSQLIKLSLQSIKFIFHYYPHRIKTIKEFIALVKYYALRLSIVYYKYKNEDVVFAWENTNDKNVVYLMKATGRKIIGFPHNLESLVSKGSVNALNEEIEVLRECNTVFTISKEETWLLRLWGVNAYYLPYYPPKEMELFLKDIHNKRIVREPNKHKHFLLLGSASNTPTRNGMQELVNYASSQEFDFLLSVAGYATESLIKVNHTRISFLGTLSPEELAELLLEIDALLIYQPPTTGSLTRIPEMLLAGIPVFVNFDAARDFHQVADINEYSSFEDLFDCLRVFDSHLVSKYELNQNYILDAIEMLKQMMN